MACHFEQHQFQCLQKIRQSSSTTSPDNLLSSSAWHAIHRYLLPAPPSLHRRCQLVQCPLKVRLLQHFCNILSINGILLLLRLNLGFMHFPGDGLLSSCQFRASAGTSLEAVFRFGQRSSALPKMNDTHDFDSGTREAPLSILDAMSCFEITTFSSWPTSPFLHARTSSASCKSQVAEASSKRSCASVAWVWQVFFLQGSPELPLHLLFAAIRSVMQFPDQRGHKVVVPVSPTSNNVCLAW